MYLPFNASTKKLKKKGKGKSSLINRLRGLSDPEPDVDREEILEENLYDIAAPTGLGETTKFPVSYSLKNRPIIFKDFPGYGLLQANNVIENYVSKYLSHDDCHSYIILYTERLTNLELNLAKLVKTNLKKNFILVRSKFDTDLNENKDKKKFEKEKQRLLNSEIHQHEFASLFDVSFSKKDVSILFISCKEGYENDYDMGLLLKKLNEMIPNELDNYDDDVDDDDVFSFLNMAKDGVRRIRSDLEKRIIGLSILSAATDFVPIAGQLTDLAILVGECTRYRNRFCLRRKYIDELGRKYNISEDKIANILQIIAFDAKYLNIKNFVLLLISSVSVGISVAAILSGASLGNQFSTIFF